MAVFVETHKMDFLPGRYWNLQSLWVHYPTIPFLLTCAQIQLFSFINSGFFSVMHNPVSSRTQSLIFLSTLQLQILFAPLFSTQHPIILQHDYRLPSHLPASLSFAFYPYFPGSPLSPCQLVPLALRWHNPCHIVTLQSSDANGCTANPAAGKPGPVPIPALPGYVTAATCSVMPIMHQRSQTQSSKAGGGWTGWWSGHYRRGHEALRYCQDCRRRYTGQEGDCICADRAEGWRRRVRETNLKVVEQEVAAAPKNLHVEVWTNKTDIIYENTPVYTSLFDIFWIGY